MRLHGIARLHNLLWSVALVLSATCSSSGTLRAEALPQRDPVPSERVILQLGGTPVRSLPSVLGLSSVEVAAHAAQLQEQSAAVAALAAEAVPGASAERTYASLFHGVTLRLPEGAADSARERLRSLPGVVAVYDDLPFEPTLYSSAAQVGVASAWEALGGPAGAGAGVRVAVIDSGLDPSHPILGAGALAYPAGFPRGDARYTTPKVIAARIYVRPSDPPVSGEDTPTPGARGSAHGTHLAGIVAGSPVTATYLGVPAPISGVAPASWLLNYRVFYPSVAGREVAYTAELLAAVEDAVADGADVILAGWTAPSGMIPSASPLSLALEAAMDTGCVVVASAGNGGPQYGSATGSPGGEERVLTVGASSKGQVLVGDWIDVTAPAPVLPELTGGRYGRAAFGPQIATAIDGPFAGVASVAGDGSSLACAALPTASLSGRVAVAQRGECAFADKAYNAERAGAVALVVANTTDEVTDMACAGTHCAAGEIGIPAVLVAASFGERLLAWATLYPAHARLTLDPGGRLTAIEPDVVAVFSGRGPSAMRYTKPDLLAPGEAILSAGTGNSPGYVALSGSSMAAAHVAGAAALVLQAHPTWGHDDVKAALMQTAANVGRVADGSALRAALPLEGGAGRLDVAAAVSAPLLLSPPSLSIPRVIAGGSAEVALLLRDMRETGSAATYAIILQQAEGLALDPMPAVTLQPGEEARRTLIFHVAATASGDLQTWVTVTGLDRTARVPVWLHVEPSLRAGSVLVIDNDFSQFEAYNDYTEYVTRALASGGWAHSVWDADARFGQQQTIPSLEQLQRHSAVIWVTGDNRHPDGYYALSTPLTVADQAILARYLDGGGRLIALGQNLAEASDINRDADPVFGRSALYHQYLGAHWLQGSLYGPDGGASLPPGGGPAVFGLPGTFLAGVGLDLGADGDGAGNQVSVDEIAPGGLLDGEDAALVYPVLAATGGQPLGEGFVGLAKACEPSLDDATAHCPYRTLYYSFGLEGINDDGGRTTRADLLGRSLRWLLDEVSATLEPEYVGAPGEPLVVRAVAGTTLGEMESFRWRVGDRVFDTVDPQVTLYLENGTWPITVEAHDSYGHRAVASASARITAGGASSLGVSPTWALPGGAVTFTVRLRHEGLAPLAMAISMPLAEDLEFVSLDGGSCSEGLWSWAGQVGPGEERILTLVARLADGAKGLLSSTATFTAGEATFQRRADVTVGTRMVFPLVTRNGTP